MKELCCLQSISRKVKVAPSENGRQQDFDDGLHELVKMEKLKRIRKLLNKVSHPPVDLRTEKEFFNRTALHIACICGHEEAVQLLLDIKQIKI